MSERGDAPEGLPKVRLGPPGERIRPVLPVDDQYSHSIGTSAMTRVLIVDDSVSIVRVMRLLLERSGFQVESAQDDGLFDLVDRWAPSVVLMDAHLPHLDGIDACRRLKESPATAAMPVILLTADPDAPALAREARADEIVMKPFRSSDLIEAIRRLVPSEPSRTAIAAGAIDPAG